MMSPATAYKKVLQSKDEQEQIILEELPQVYYIAKRIHERLPQHVPFEDLIHTGVLGLIDALRNFDPDKKVQFKTYAKFRVRGAILDSLRELDWAPRRLRRKAKRVDDAVNKLVTRLGRQPDEEEMAAEIGIDLPEMHKLLAHLDGLELVSQQVDHGSDRTETRDLIESAPAAESENPYEQCLRTELKEHLAGIIATLSEREQLVVSLYYRDELTMKEIGAVLDLAESSISQIHSVALTKLRAALRRAAVNGSRAYAKE
jgi:RNA polymerase sigma factor FliA